MTAMLQISVAYVYQHGQSEFVFGGGIYNYLHTDLAQIEHIDEYPTMHYFGNPRPTQSMTAYMILTEYFWKFQ